ncbi:DUF3168 domain-containing protein [Streptomyces ovatisporus]|uniref:DUF3168 domain-containing protein n=1 Tax=Streptomyces ovatisporus TaxID=1128682 RepID=A0ABV9A4C8_9ACTN
MATALWPLQKAVITALKGDSAFMSLVTGVYDRVPSDRPLPYVTLGSITEHASDSHTDRGLDSYLVLHIWSEYEGNKEAAQILEALDAVLDRQTLPVIGWQNVSIAFESADTVGDPNPDIRHINVRYRVWLTKI